MKKHIGLKLCIVWLVVTFIAMVILIPVLALFLVSTIITIVSVFCVAKYTLDKFMD